jgi:ABC-type phosphate transport system substrate-binding protein
MTIRQVVAVVGALSLVLCDAGPALAEGGVVVIGHQSLSGLDGPTLEKIYTGRVIEVNGVPVTAVNASVGSRSRARFLQTYLNEDEEKYTAYWVVRRYIGKGAPPREIPNAAAIVSFVRSTPGAIGYVEEADVQPGVVVLLR